MSKNSSAPTTNCEISRKPKLPTNNVKITRVDIEHYLVSFKYEEYQIFHTIDDVLDAIKKEVKNE